MDIAIAEAINGFGSGTFIDVLTMIISNYAFIALSILVILVIIFVRDRKKAKIVVLALVITLILHFAISEGLIKGLIADNIYFRERPWIAYPGEIIPLGKCGIDSSFPSSHMSSTVALLTVLILFYRKKIKWILPASILFVLLMGFARIHNGMHYPSDVLVGAVLGILYGWCAVWLTNRFWK
jgi:undecaprenyl-diphosphatase